MADCNFVNIHNEYLTSQLYRAEFEQNFVARAEFWAEYAIFTSIAGRQNMPIYEQNLSKPNRWKRAWFTCLVFCVVDEGSVETCVRHTEKPPEQSMRTCVQLQNVYELLGQTARKDSPYALGIRFKELSSFSSTGRWCHIGCQTVICFT